MYQPTEFALELQAHMEEWYGEMCPCPPIWADWTDGIHPDYRDLAKHVRRVDEVKLHKHAARLLSSQAFAFNLFLPFRVGPREYLSQCVGETVGTRLSVDRVNFEWVPPGALLGELEGERPANDEPATAVDVVLWCRLVDGQRAAVLIEVKLSEAEFTTCNGRWSRANRRTDVCMSARLFLKNPSACYLRRPWGRHRDRRYWEIFTASHGSVGGAFPGVDIEGACPFVGNAQQPMRNLAIARALEQEGTVARAWFVLCAHDDNSSIHQHWEAWKALLPDPKMAPLLRTSAVVGAGTAEKLESWAEWMKSRYRLKRV